MERVAGEQAACPTATPGLVGVLEDVEGAADRAAVVDEDGDGTVDGVHPPHELAPLSDAEVLLDIVEGDAELPQCDARPHPEAIGPEVDARHLAGGGGHGGGGPWWRRVLCALFGCGVWWRVS